MRPCHCDLLRGQQRSGRRQYRYGSWWSYGVAVVTIKGSYHVAAAHHKRRTGFPRSFADGVPSPLHLVFSSTTSTTAFENPFNQELIRLDAIRVSDGEVEAQAVARNLFASTSVLKVDETVTKRGRVR